MGDWLIEDCAEVNIPYFYRHTQPQEVRDKESGEIREVRSGIINTVLGGEAMRVDFMFVSGHQIMSITTTVLDDKGNDKEDTEFVLLERIPCNLGGVMVLGRCPDCRRQVRKLFKPQVDLNFRCNKCYRLVYKRSRISGNKLKILEYKIERLAKKLGATGADIKGAAPIPPRPRYMHLKTYTRLVVELWLLKLEYDDISKADVNRLLKQPTSSPNRMAQLRLFLGEVPESVTVICIKAVGSPDILDRLK